jgi:acetyl esterase/lipase
MHSRSHYLIIGIVVFANNDMLSANAPTHKDIVYATVDGKELKLDLYLPSNPVTSGLLVFVHGGAWRGGSKDGVPKVFPDNGIPTASIEFRQSTEAKISGTNPRHQGSYSVSSCQRSYLRLQCEKVVIVGSSSGGHLASLTGVTTRMLNLKGRSAAIFNNHPVSRQ